MFDRTRTGSTAWQGWRLPFGFLAGILAWALQLLIGYGLTPLACMTGARLPVDLVGAIAALVTLGAGVIATGGWRVATDSGRPDIVDLERGQDRREFVAVAGVFLSSLFLLLILATLIVGLFQNPCPVITQSFP